MAPDGAIGGLTASMARMACLAIEESAIAFDLAANGTKALLTASEARLSSVVATRPRASGILVSILIDSDNNRDSGNRALLICPSETPFETGHFRILHATLALQSSYDDAGRYTDLSSERDDDALVER